MWLAKLGFMAALLFLDVQHVTGQTCDGYGANYKGFVKACNYDLKPKSDAEALENDIGGMGSYGACFDKCEGHRQCEGFVYDKEKKICHLRKIIPSNAAGRVSSTRFDLAWRIDSCVQAVGANTGYYDGFEVTCQDGWQGMAFERVENVNTFVLCEKICANDPTCSIFKHYKYDRRCFIGRGQVTGQIEYSGWVAATGRKLNYVPPPPPPEPTPEPPTTAEPTIAPEPTTVPEPSASPIPSLPVTCPEFGDGSDHKGYRLRCGHMATGGDMYGEESVFNFHECLQLCTNNSDCVLFNFELSTGICFLSNAFNKFQKFSSFDSGAKLDVVFPPTTTTSSVSQIESCVCWTTIFD